VLVWGGRSPEVDHLHPPLQLGAGTMSPDALEALRQASVALDHAVACAHDDPASADKDELRELAQDADQLWRRLEREVTP
jgi:hypothetical protein